MSFHVGQKVVCIGDVMADSPYPAAPKIGSIYTVRGIDPTDGVLLVEIINPRMLCYSTVDRSVCNAEPSFWPHHFRPIEERKTDISIFTKMLQPSELARNRALCGND